ncbi:uncharacterized protein TNCV_1958831 [Trichonephila clavipes]|nr:uncharacterized protein TNCV_1958831 [Trichonephila clavipes]
MRNLGDIAKLASPFLAIELSAKLATLETILDSSEPSGFFWKLVEKSTYLTLYDTSGDSYEVERTTIGVLSYSTNPAQENHRPCSERTKVFVEWAQNEIAVVPDFHKRILFSDEAHFWLNGYVNKQNCRIWSEANPQVYVETPLHPEKLTVWCALWAGGIIGPYFFKNDEGHNVTVNGDRYRAMITNFFIPELNNHDVQELWFQQDGATCHTARATIDLLKDMFGDRLISRFGPVNWPPSSCDLTPLDYFLWGYVQSLVYADKPQTLDHLEDNIRSVIADIRPQMLEKVIENWTSRLDYTRASRGSHMPEIIFKMEKCGRKEFLKEKKRKRLIAVENPLSQRTSAKKLVVLQSTICRQIKKIGYEKVNKPVCLQISLKTVKKRIKRSWSPYLMFRKGARGVGIRVLRIFQLRKLFCAIPGNGLLRPRECTEHYDRAHGSYQRNRDMGAGGTEIYNGTDTVYVLSSAVHSLYIAEDVSACVSHHD